MLRRCDGCGVHEPEEELFRYERSDFRYCHYCIEQKKTNAMNWVSDSLAQRGRVERIEKLIGVGEEKTSKLPLGEQIYKNKGDGMELIMSKADWLCWSRRNNVCKDDSIPEFPFFVYFVYIHPDLKVSTMTLEKINLLQATIIGAKDAISQNQERI